MANIIKIKRSAVASKVPLTTDLELGELAINTFDGKLFLKKNDGTDAIVTLGESGGPGPTGYTGSQGPIGYTGSASTVIGYTGSQGIQGITGFTGSVGNNGVTGFTGSQGIQGITGFTGSVGFVGSASTVIGYTGSVGFVGSAGPSTAINATDDSATTLLYPVFVGAAGSNQTPKVTTPKLSWNASTGALTIVGSLYASSKSFRIPHPTKLNSTLTYGSLEGPENGVYYRGRTNTNIIELPEYWSELVHEHSITVDLTPIGKYQKLYVDKIENNKIYIFNDNIFNSNIDCFFAIFAERKDVDSLEVES